MPHQCTSCGYVFSDGSKEMLSGCPECSGTTFQFHPNALSIPESPSDESPPTDSESRVEKHLGKATSKVRRLMSSSDSQTASHTTNVDNGSPSAEFPSSPSGSEPAEEMRTESIEPFSGEPNRAETITANSIGTGSSTAQSTSTSEPADSQSTDRTDTSIDQSDTSTAHDEHEHTGGADVLGDTDAVREPEDAAQATARSELISSDILAARANDSTTAESASRSRSEMDSHPSHSDSSSRSPHSNSDSSSPLSPQDSDTDPHGPSPPPSDGRIVRSPTGEQPDLSDLRRELNDQFESIKIVEPGEYELNLMDLYDREEYIIALQENGRYVIQMPETWIGNDTD